MNGAENITVEYLAGITEGNIRGEREFLIVPLFSFIVYGSEFFVYWWNVLPVF